MRFLDRSAFKTRLFGNARAHIAVQRDTAQYTMSFSFTQKAANSCGQDCVSTTMRNTSVATTNSMMAMVGSIGAIVLRLLELVKDRLGQCGAVLIRQVRDRTGNLPLRI